MLRRSVVGNFFLLAQDSPALDADLDAVGAGLDGELLILDIRDLAYDTAAGGDDVADLEAVAHFLIGLVSLALRTDQNEIEYDDDKNEGKKRKQGRGGVRGFSGGGRGSHQKDVL